MLSGINVTDIVSLVLALLIGVIVHELMHGVVAYWLGDTTAADAGRLTLNPLKSIDPLTTVVLPIIFILTVHQPFFAAKPVPFNPGRVRWGEYGAALVGLAGPAINFLLAIVGAGLFHLTGAGILHTFAEYFTFVNIGMMVFNLIPFPPLDGSRVLYAFAPEPVQEVMARIENMGLVPVLLFIFVFFQLLAPVILNIDNTIINWLLGGVTI